MSVSKHINPMKIAFICGSLAPGLDGVGDYTRRLSANLETLGYNVTVIAYNDRHIKSLRTETQEADGVQVNVLRIPASMNERQRTLCLRNKLTDLSPHWVSLQYVPYSFDKRGMPIGFPGALKRSLGNAKVHIMYHELWQGESNESTFKDKIIGRFQKMISLSLISRLKAERVTTTNEYYKQRFERAKVVIDKLPVFSNIPVGDITGNKVINKLPGYVLSNRGKYLLAVFFGGFHFHEYLTERLKQLNEKVTNELHRSLVVLHIGRSNGIDTVFDKLRHETGILMHVLGEWPPQDVADLLAHANIGLSNYPMVLFEKSGSIAALLNNGCPVLILRKGFEESKEHVLEVKELVKLKDLNQFVLQPRTFTETYGIHNTVKKYHSIFQEI
jgi:hypothetical protein